MAEDQEKPAQPKAEEPKEVEPAAQAAQDVAAAVSQIVSSVVAASVNLAQTATAAITGFMQVGAAAGAKEISDKVDRYLAALQEGNKKKPEEKKPDA